MLKKCLTIITPLLAVTAIGTLPPGVGAESFRHRHHHCPPGSSDEDYCVFHEIEVVGSEAAVGRHGETWIKLACSRIDRCKGTLTISAHGSTLASGQYDIEGGEVGVAHVRLTASALSALESARTLSVRATAADVGGASDSRDMTLHLS